MLFNVLLHVDFSLGLQPGLCAQAVEPVTLIRHRKLYKSRSVNPGDLKLGHAHPRWYARKILGECGEVCRSRTLKIFHKKVSSVLFLLFALSINQTSESFMELLLSPENE